MQSKFLQSILSAISAVSATVACGAALAAEHVVSAGASSFDCSRVQPGDVVTLGSGVRGSLVIRNCSGAESRPIRIQNDPDGSGPTVIQRSSGGSGGFVFNCVDCVHVEIDGSAKWRGAPAGKTYGIKITMSAGGSPSAFLNIGGVSRFLAIRGVEIDGRWPAVSQNGIGIMVNDHSIKLSQHPNLWREQIVIEENFVHHVEGEGLYVGSNWHENPDLPLRNITIRNNLIEDTGWDGINLKSAIAGDNRIHNNVLRRVGSGHDNAEGQHHGITILDGRGRIYSNWIEDAGQTGILHFLMKLPTSYGEQTSEIFNNVIVRSGRLRPDSSYAISSANRNGAPIPAPRIYNNTIVSARGVGIHVGSRASDGVVCNNIVADAARSALALPKQVSESDNLVGPISEMGFIDAGQVNFRLESDSPARDAAGPDYPDTDFRGIERPQDNAPDQGAFEYNGASTDPPRPRPPVLSVE